MDICWNPNKRVNPGGKIWRPAKWSGKSSMEIIKKCHYQLSGES